MKRFSKKLSEFFNWIKKVYRAENMGIRDRMFLVVSTLGTLISLACTIETIFVSTSIWLVVILVLLFTLLLAGMISSIRGKGVNWTATAVAVYLTIVILPCIFILGGGIEGGAALWFLLGYFYIFLFFSGWKLVALLVTSGILDVLIYAFSYLHPEYIQAAASQRAAYADSLFGVLGVGITVGILLRIEMRFYENENQTVKKQKEELEVAGKARNRLFAGMSHEVRTPINTIIGLNELTMRADPSDEIKSYSKDIDSAANMLLSLVNDILDISKIETDQMDIVPIQYQTKELFQSLYEMMRVHAKRKNLEFRMEIDPQLPSVLYGDQKRVEQILINLLTNAVKYTEKGSIILTALGEKTEDGNINLTISVKDTGRGIKKEDIEYIYESFRRFERERNYSIEGSGLGLAIVKQLVDRMEGTITVDSIYTRGSTFTINLPQKVVEHYPIGNLNLEEDDNVNRYHYHQKFEAPNVRILVVDDNHMNTVVTSRLLSATRMQIYSAKSGKECLEMTRQKAFQVILMDYMMPDMNGLETVMELRKQENGLCRETPVIALTAATPDENRALMSSGQFASYLEKPIRSELLEEAILNVLPKEMVDYRQDSVTNQQKSEADTSIHRRSKVKITTDCICDLPREILEKYNIGQQYLYIQTERGRFKDTVEIDSDNMSQYLTKEKEKPRAASCNVSEFESFFAENLLEAVDIIHISMASRSGRTYAIAQEAAEGFDHVHVVDSGLISCGQGLLVIEAAKLAKQGKSVEEILAVVNDLKQYVDCGFWTPSADYLSEFGYVKRRTAKTLKNLHLHPTLTLRNNRISATGLSHGEQENVLRRYIGRRLRHQNRIDTEAVVVTFANCSAHVKELVLDEITRRVDFDHLLVTKSSFSNACSCGPGTFGLAFYDKE